MTNQLNHGRRARNFISGLNQILRKSFSDPLLRHFLISDCPRVSQEETQRLVSVDWLIDGLTVVSYCRSVFPVRGEGDGSERRVSGHGQSLPHVLLRLLLLRCVT